ncbi:endonuclease V [Streptomyces sp. URMC 123]|uniref:endonuclease V n=1 Tax=Streptomyces sp. URMC 123 TaxID=3423403 RepID=UPI003F1BA38C
MVWTRGPWPTTEAEAVAEQERLRGLVDLVGPGPAPGATGTVAGVDVAYDEATDRVAAAAVVLDAESLDVVERATAVGRATFLYVPGLLAFRELPPVLEALEKLSALPDLVVCDGYGVAHPRRLGLASHLGVVTGLPSFGVAKTPFAFTHEPPGPARGAWSPLLDGDEVVGRALRTREGVKPVFVSVGHGVTLDAACAHTLRLTPRYRLPETTRGADSLCRRALADALATARGGV